MGNSSSSTEAAPSEPAPAGRGGKEKGRVDPSDPRSPSKEVSRTPLRLAESSSQQSIDPRSPSTCVERTPIQITQLKVHKPNSAVSRDPTPPEKLALDYENIPPAD